MGARPRKPGYKSNAYPTLPTTLEEEVTPASGRTETWVQENKYTPQRFFGENRTARTSGQDEAAGQPPDYNQTMKLQPFLLQPTNQFQHGYQINGTGLNQQQQPGTSQQSFFVSPALGQVSSQGISIAPSQTQTQPGLNTVENTMRGPTAEDKLKEVKRRLEKRGIPVDDWQYYTESPHSWDYSEVTSSE